MKILRTLPFVVVALLSVYSSAAGAPPSLMWVLGVLFTLVAAAMSLAGYADLPTMWGFTESPETPQREKQRRLVIGLSLAVVVSVLALHWPLRACFWLSRPALERVALQARAAPFRAPQSAGLFTIQDVDLNGGEAVLWLDGDGGEPTILVRKSSSAAASRSGSDRIDLDEQWYFYSEL